ncbi:Uma2 family endonuclease, partial [Pseudanabaenaceae cyanobacterium LEGE 13415]|nr:Uma2 family endonuclease [Pseudanabaenaceae cyanobacterium LEGE 13415]
CFYIDNWQAAVGKDRIDWQTELPPDLVIEIDVTTYTAAEDYLPYRVPEVWLFKKNRFLIHQLENDRYVLRETSQFFPGIDIKTIASQCLQDAAERGTGVAIRELRSRF